MLSTSYMLLSKTLLIISFFRVAVSFTAYSFMVNGIENKLISNRRNSISSSNLLKASSSNIQPLANPQSKSKDVEVVGCQVTDIFEILDMCNTQFLSKDKYTFKEWFELNIKILTIFMPKFLYSDVMGHKIIGLRSNSNSKLVGFVDISLQTNNGSLDPLTPTTLLFRQDKFKNQLQPYICNLLIRPEYRNQGLASMLIQECEKYCKSIPMPKQILNTNRNRKSSFDYSNNDKKTIKLTSITHMYLHVESNETPALALYLKNGFQEMGRISMSPTFVIHMRKTIL